MLARCSVRTRGQRQLLLMSVQHSDGRPILFFDRGMQVCCHVIESMHNTSVAGGRSSAMRSAVRIRGVCRRGGGGRYWPAQACEWAQRVSSPAAAPGHHHIRREAFSSTTTAARVHQRVNRQQPHTGALLKTHPQQTQQQQRQQGRSEQALHRPSAGHPHTTRKNT
jgi:hypothetical protein